jgi:hypothetical protein
MCLEIQPTIGQDAEEYFAGIQAIATKHTLATQVV